MEILKAVILLGIMGLIFGAVLAFAAQKFAVEVDEREAKILEVLPGANCGGCGYPGCGGVAAAIVKGEAPVNACPVGGSAVAAKVGEIMGVAAETGEKQVAHVMCKGTCSSAANKYEYQGITDCRAAVALIGGPKSCSFGCLGLGTCVSVCAFGALSIVDGVAVVDEDKCVLCGKCIDTCPKGLIQKKPAKQEVVVECSSKDKGKDVKDKCSAGCIGCKKCEKLEESVKKAVIELNLNLPISHITDFTQIASYGVMSTPALVLNGEVVSFGKVLSVEEVKHILSNKMKGKVKLCKLEIKLNE